MLHEPQQTILMTTRFARECSYLRSFCASGDSSGLATIILTRVSRVGGGGGGELVDSVVMLLILLFVLYFVTVVVLRFKWHKLYLCSQFNFNFASSRCSSVALLRHGRVQSVQRPVGRKQKQRLWKKHTTAIKELGLCPRALH
jgi:hypothetical protein